MSFNLDKYILWQLTPACAHLVCWNTSPSEHKHFQPQLPGKNSHCSLLSKARTHTPASSSRQEPTLQPPLPKTHTAAPFYDRECSTAEIFNVHTFFLWATAIHATFNIEFHSRVIPFNTSFHLYVISFNTSIHSTFEQIHSIQVVKRTQAACIRAESFSPESLQRPLHIL